VEGKLSYEHVPPEAAFNGRPMIYSSAIEILSKNEEPDAFDKISGKTKQRGMGAYTLCPKCNNNTGAWYGNRYVDWAHQGMTLAQYASVAPSLAFTFQIFPLYVIKQIVCMFFSANHDGFRDAHPDLVKFVLDPRTRYLKPEVKVWAYFNLSPRARQSGIVGSASLRAGDPIRVFSEISFPPFGYVMTINSEPPNRHMVDISFFSRFERNEWVDINLKLPILSVYSIFPGDYRSRDEVVAQTAANIVANPRVRL
jgi:hypothetical protein